MTKDINKKRVGIITFPNADNYGAVLQSYALQRIIQEELSKDVELINFCPEDEKRAYRIFAPHSKKLLSNIVIKALVAYHFFSYYIKKHRFKCFREEYLHFSQPWSEFHTIMEELPGKYDVYISGSDQVFNPLNKYLRLYYLDFQKKGSKKVAYAPSFGFSDFSTPKFDRIINYLNDFDSLSCREQDGSQWIQSIISKEAPCLLDPVFLLTPNQWREIMVGSDKKDYIFVYNLNGGANLMKVVEKVKKETGLPIICATPSYLPISGFGTSVKRNLGPREFVGMIANAKYVVTDSFHGTAFSILFSKPVISYIAMESSSGRIYSLLRLCSMEEQIVRDPDPFEFGKISFATDSVKALMPLIDQSKLYLKKAIQ